MHDRGEPERFILFVLEELPAYVLLNAPCIDLLAFEQQAKLPR